MNAIQSRISICLILLVVLFWPSSLLASQAYRIKTASPAPRLISPNEELLISGNGPAEFKWSPAYLPRGGFYDFRIYEGTELVQSTLIFKSRVPSNQNSIQVSADLFAGEKLYAWSVRSATPHAKSRSNYSIFKVKKQRPVPAGAESAQSPGSESHGHEKFEMETIRGVISSYDFEAVSPWLKIKSETGKDCTVAVDLKMSKIISSNGKEVAWNSLQEGTKVEIVYAAESASESKSGVAKLVLHSITIKA